MAACWPLQMPPTPKAVLISLADNANDQGHCWPSLTTIAERTCFGRTAVIEAIKWLESHGAVAADRSDRYRTTYVVTPSKFMAPGLVRETNQSVRRTSSNGGELVRLADDEVRQPDDEVREADTNRQEPSRTVNKSNRQKARERAALSKSITSIKGVNVPPRPDDAEPQPWADWLGLRKAKSAPVTETVVAQARSEAAKAGVSLTRFLEIWCARGSQGLQADWLKPHERAGPDPVAQPMGKQMQGLMALEELKRGARERMAADRDRGGAAETRLLVSGPHAGR